MRLRQPDWGPDSHSLAVEAELRQERLDVFLILNAYWEPLDFELPPAMEGGASAWRRWIDTALASPLDIVPWQTAPSLTSQLYEAAPHSVAVLFRENVLDGSVP